MPWVFLLQFVYKSAMSGAILYSLPAMVGNFLISITYVTLITLAIHKWYRLLCHGHDLALQIFSSILVL